MSEFKLSEFELWFLPQFQFLGYITINFFEFFFAIWGFWVVLLFEFLVKQNLWQKKNFRWRKFFSEKKCFGEQFFFGGGELFLWKMFSNDKLLLVNKILGEISIYVGNFFGDQICWWKKLFKEKKSFVSTKVCWWKKLFSEKVCWWKSFLVKKSILVNIIIVVN